jgi:5-dehydro-2-deoxygluconokinase
VILDGDYGREALFTAVDANLWIARPVERPGSRPLAFTCADLGTQLLEWPATQIVKCLCFYHPEDTTELKAQQDKALLRLQAVCRTLGRELLVEIIARHGAVGETTAATVVEHLYAVGLKPDWWKLEPQPSAAAWSHVERAIRSGDPHCRGVLLLGFDAPEGELIEAFSRAAATPVVKGFAIGRTIFAEVARAWLAGGLADGEAVSAMADKFRRLSASWDEATRRQAAA